MGDRLAGKVTIVTGAGSGIGRASAIRFAEEEARVPAGGEGAINDAHAEMLGGLQEVYATIDSFQPIGRPGTPRELANVALFLASDESSFATGAVIVADGAMTAK